MRNQGNRMANFTIETGVAVLKFSQRLIRNEGCQKSDDSSDSDRRTGELRSAGEPAAQVDL